MLFQSVAQYLGVLRNDQVHCTMLNCCAMALWQVLNFKSLKKNENRKMIKTKKGPPYGRGLTVLYQGHCRILILLFHSLLQKVLNRLLHKKAAWVQWSMTIEQVTTNQSNHRTLSCQTIDNSSFVKMFRGTSSVIVWGSIRYC